MKSPFSGHNLDAEEEQLLQQIAEHWRQVWNNAPVQSVMRIEDAAKQVITITAGLQVVYVGIFAFSSLPSQVTQVRSIVPHWLLLLLFFLPLVSWLVSLAYAIHVFVPRIRPEVNFNEVNPSAWQKVKDAYARAAEEKLRAASGTLVVDREFYADAAGDRTVCGVACAAQMIATKNSTSLDLGCKYGNCVNDIRTILWLTLPQKESRSATDLSKFCSRNSHIYTKHAVAC